MKKPIALLFGLCLPFLIAGCASTTDVPGGGAAAVRTQATDQILDKDYVLSVINYVYRWHFDQSYVIGADKQNTLEVWARPLSPELDEGDRSQFAELWIPAVNTRVELKRSDYELPELKLHVKDQDFKVKRVTRQARPPAARSRYEVRSLPLTEVQDYLFAKRSDHRAVSNQVRQAGRELILGFLAKEHPAEFTTDQVFHIAPVSTVCNDCWVFWETGRKVMLFSADMDLSQAGAAELGQLKMQVVNLDKDVVVSPKEVPGSNAFVTKDWVGRLFFNCIMYGERLVLTPEQMRTLRAAQANR